MAAKERSGIAVGLKKGHVSLLVDMSKKFRSSKLADDDPGFQKTTPREFKPRISRTKGHLSKRTAFVREIVKEVSGYVYKNFQQPKPPMGWWIGLIIRVVVAGAIYLSFRGMMRVERFTSR